jgi:hypothetical protein
MAIGNVQQAHGDKPVDVFPQTVRPPRQCICDLFEIGQLAAVL